MKRNDKVFDKVGCHLHNGVGYHPALNLEMKKQVIIHIDPAEHARLKKKAKAERRKIGDQLLYQALAYEEKSVKSEPEAVAV